MSHLHIFQCWYICNCHGIVGCCTSIRPLVLCCTGFCLASRAGFRVGGARCNNICWCSRVEVETHHPVGRGGEKSTLGAEKGTEIGCEGGKGLRIEGKDLIGGRRKNKWKEEGWMDRIVRQGRRGAVIRDGGGRGHLHQERKKICSALQRVSPVEWRKGWEGGERGQWADKEEKEEGQNEALNGWPGSPSARPEREPNECPPQRNNTVGGKDTCVWLLSILSLLPRLSCLLGVQRV